MIKAHILEEGIREQLRRCLPTDDLCQQYRDELWEAVSRAQRPETLKETAIRRLESQLDRARRLLELGEYDEETFVLKRSAIRQEQERLKAEMATSTGQRDLEWCRAQLFDLVGAWDAADGAQRTRLLAGLFEHIEARADPSRGVHVVAVPRPGWRSFYEHILALELQTGACSNFSDMRTRLEELAAGIRPQ